MSLDSRELSYSLAINEALHQMMSKDERVFLIGQGVKSPWYVGNTARGLIERFGEERVIDTPVSENSVTGVAVGAAIAGMRPIVVHPRMDFMLYALDPIINEAANWHYMSGGASCVPVVFWGIINRGGEQAAQHSQALHSIFAHIPGLKVVMPATPYDAKGLMISAIEDDNPVVFIDDRWLYPLCEPVPSQVYRVPIGKGVVRREGKDVSVIAISYMVGEALNAASILSERYGIEIEVIDLRSIKPYDRELIRGCVKKSGRVILLDVGWTQGGFMSEVAAFIVEECFYSLRSPLRRLALPDVPAPASRKLEEVYYPRSSEVVDLVLRVIKDGA